MRELPIYKMIIDDTDLDDTEVNYVSLVDEPAIERLWHKFEDVKEFKFQADEDRRILTGAFMIADLPIYRRDANLGEYYVVFDRDNIEKAAMKFFRKGYTSNVNFMHQDGSKIEDAFVFESFLIDESRGISAPKGFEGLPDGSWVGSVKIDNKEFWKNYVATEAVMGFSVEGLFGHELDMTEDEKVINQIIKEING